MIYVQQFFNAQCLLKFLVTVLQQITQGKKLNFFVVFVTCFYFSVALLDPFQSYSLCKRLKSRRNVINILDKRTNFKSYGTLFGSLGFTPSLTYTELRLSLRSAHNILNSEGKNDQILPLSCLVGSLQCLRFVLYLLSTTQHNLPIHSVNNIGFQLSETLQ